MSMFASVWDTLSLWNQDTNFGGTTGHTIHIIAFAGASALNECIFHSFHLRWACWGLVFPLLAETEGLCRDDPEDTAVAAENGWDDKEDEEVDCCCCVPLFSLESPSIHKTLKFCVFISCIRRSQVSLIYRWISSAFGTWGSLRGWWMFRPGPVWLVLLKTITSDGEGGPCDDPDWLNSSGLLFLDSMLSNLWDWWCNRAFAVVVNRLGLLDKYILSYLKGTFQ